MSLDVFYAKWQKIADLARGQWGNFIQDDILKVETEYNKLIHLLQKHHGYSREQARIKADLCLRDHDSTASL